MVVFAIESRVWLRSEKRIFWLIYEISDVDADGIWLGVLLFFRSNIRICFMVLFIHRIVLIRVYSIRSFVFFLFEPKRDMKITLRARHEVYDIIDFLFSFPTKPNSNKSNEAYNSDWSLVWRENTEKFCEMPNIQWCTYMCRKYLKCSSAFSLRSHYVRDDRLSTCINGSEWYSEKEGDRQTKRVLSFYVYDMRWYNLCVDYVLDISLFLFFASNIQDCSSTATTTTFVDDRYSNAEIDVVLVHTIVYLNSHTGSFTSHVKSGGIIFNP